MKMAGFDFPETNSQMAYCTIFIFCTFFPEAAGEFVMSYFTYLALQKESNTAYE